MAVAVLMGVTIHTGGKTERSQQGMSSMVRMLEPTAQGISLELHCFTADTALLTYRNTQSDIFDHLLAILPEFGRWFHQQPSGNELRMGITGMQRLPAATEAAADSA